MSGEEELQRRLQEAAQVSRDDERTEFDFSVFERVSSEMDPEHTSIAGVLAAIVY